MKFIPTFPTFALFIMVAGLTWSCSPNPKGNSLQPTAKAPVAEVVSTHIPEEMQESIDQISNDHLKWDGTGFGLLPAITNAETERLVHVEEDIHAQLYAKLSDPGAFAAAHVVLTFRAQENILGSSSDWNGLQVSLHADGSVSYEMEDIPDLLKKWKP